MGFLHGDCDQSRQTADVGRPVVPDDVSAFILPDIVRSHIPQKDTGCGELSIHNHHLAGLQRSQSFALIGILLAAQRRNARLQTAGTKTDHDDASDETTE